MHKSNICMYSVSNIQDCDGIVFSFLMQVYSNQFPTEKYDVSRYIVKFDAQCDLASSPAAECVPAIKIHFPEERLDGGWLLELKSSANEVGQLLASIRSYY